MSNLTNTYSEILNCIPVAGAALSDTATGACLNTAAQAAILPIGFFNAYSVNKTIQFTGWGIISSPSSGTATITLSPIATVTINSITSAITLGSSPAITPVASLANNQWTINGWSTVQSISTTSVEMITFGEVTIAGALAATTANVTYQFGSSTPVAITTAFSTEYGFELKGIWGSGVSGDTITCEQWIVQGMN